MDIKIMSRRRKIKIQTDSWTGVDMSPLIDCVFLLLIFFLVTTMIKKKEKLLSVKLPDQTSSLSDNQNDNTLILAIDETGKTYIMKNKGGFDGKTVYTPVKNMALHLKNIIKQKGDSFLTTPLRIDCDRLTAFQKVINLLDICKMSGFDNVSIRIREKSK